MRLDDLFSSSAGEMRFSAIRRLHSLSQKPNIISFAAGQPNAETFPVQTFREVFEEILTEHGPAAFQYILTRGIPPLIEAVRSYASGKAITASSAETILVEGSQQGI